MIELGSELGSRRLGVLADEREVAAFDGQRRRRGSVAVGTCRLDGGPTERLAETSVVTIGIVAEGGDGGPKAAVCDLRARWRRGIRRPRHCAEEHIPDRVAAEIGHGGPPYRRLTSSTCNRARPSPRVAVKDAPVIAARSLDVLSAKVAVLPRPTGPVCRSGRGRSRTIGR